MKYDLFTILFPGLFHLYVQYTFFENDTQLQTYIQSTFLNWHLLADTYAIYVSKIEAAMYKCVYLYLNMNIHYDFIWKSL